MAGGNWSTQNKVRPGAYINVQSNGMSISLGGARGTVAMPWMGGFGPVGEVIEITPSTNFINVLGYEVGAPELLTIREALKNASRLLITRVTSGASASVSADELTITAKYPGSRGNDLSVQVISDVDEAGVFLVNTFLDDMQVDSQRATNIADLEDNAFVTFGGDGGLFPNAGLILSGGADSPSTSLRLMEFLEMMEAYDFNTMALPVEDNSIKMLGVAYIRRLREADGKKCQLVVAGINADSEAVINVKNGVILADGTEVSADLATAWVAGATAGANVNESNTYAIYTGAVNVTERYSNAEIVEALQRGQFVFVEKRGEVIVEQDINSLVSFSAEKNQAFSKNRVMRVLDDIANTIKANFASNFIGRVSNNEEGRNIFRASVIEYMDSLQRIGAVENFDAGDVLVHAGNHKDSVVAELRVQPTDAMEKLYMNVVVE